MANINGLFTLLKKLTKKHELAIPKIKADYDAAILAASQKVQQDMLTQLQPIFQLFATMSTSKASPGNKYLAELKFLQSGLSQMQTAQTMAASVPGAGGAVPARGVTWGMGSINLTPPLLVVPPVTPMVATTAASTFVTGKSQTWKSPSKILKLNWWRSEWSWEA